VTLTHRVNLLLPFLHADLDAGGEAWQAQPWGAGGMAAIMLHEPVNAHGVARVRDLLRSLQSDARNGIQQILERGDIKQRGAFPDAWFLVVMKPGYYAISDPNAPLLSEVQRPAGGHGFSPEFPEMRASFFVSGSGIARHRDIGVVDMRRIAPTVAQLLGVRLPSATQPPLPVRQ